MASSKEYPERPVVGVGGVIIDLERAGEHAAPGLQERLHARIAGDALAA